MRWWKVGKVRGGLMMARTVRRFVILPLFDVYAHADITDITAGARH